MTGSFSVEGSQSLHCWLTVANRPEAAARAAYKLGGAAITRCALSMAAGTCHQAGYDTVRGDPFFQMDMRIAKNIRVREGWNLQLIFQAFDLTNKTNFGSNFHNTNTSGSFMKPEGFINPSSSFTPRAFVGEFGARFTF